MPEAGRPPNFLETMAYNGNPVGSLADLIRVKAGDAGTSPILSDEAIEAFLIRNGNSVLLAAAEAAEALAAYYAHNQIDTVGDVEAAATKTQNFLRVADRLRVQAKEEAEEVTASPGCSSTALGRGSLFRRGVGYGTE